MIIIETARLILRDYNEDDILFLAEINADERVMEFFPRTLDLVETQDFVVLQSESIAQNKFGFFALEKKETREFIGFVGLKEVNFKAPFTPAVEIGWRIAHDQWNQGFATEAAKAVLDYGFNKINLQEIVSFAAKINKKSQRVMEKIGMKRDENDDFLHPNINKDHFLAPHVLYRIANNSRS